MGVAALPLVHITPLSFLILLHVANASPTDAADPPPWTWATRPQTFHIKVNFRTCTDDQAARERGLGSADPWDEDYCRTRWNGIASKERQSVNVGDFCLQTLSHHRCAWTWQSLSFGPKCEVSFFVIDTLTAHSAQPTYAVMITCGGRWQLFHSGVGL